MNWILYLLEANLYVVAFYAFYRLFLSNETFYTLNRYYLLAGTLAAFLLPVVQAGFLYDLLPGSWQNRQAPGPVQVQVQDHEAAFSYLSYRFLLPASYFAITFFLLLRLLWELCSVLFLAFKAKRNTYNQVKYFELNGSEVAFSFFGMLFLNTAAANKDIILRHEQVHMRQYHSLDTLFIEIVHAFSWFNPVLLFLKKDMNTLHEFIADDQTSSGQLVNKHEYAMLLIQNSFGLPEHALIKPIYNQSSLKSRIAMLNQPKSATRARLRMLLALPLICAMICSSTLAFSKNYKLIDLYASRQSGIQTLAQDTSKRIPPPPPPAVPKAPIALRKGNVPPPPPPAAPKAPKSLRKSNVPPPPRVAVAPAPSAAPRPAVPPKPALDPEKKN